MLRTDGLIYAQQTNIALSHCTGDWAFYIQADEVVHEDDLPNFQESMHRHLGNPAVEALPFKAKTFEYVYDSHVLEHTEDPEAACKELMRIARAGYIETPSPFYEQGYNYPNPDRGWSFHRWFVYVGEGDTLIFEPKTSHMIDEFCHCRHAQIIKRIYQSGGDLIRIHRVLPRECNYTVMRWVDRFKFAVKNKTGDRTGC